jgi:hypothetical protein
MSVFIESLGLLPDMARKLLDNMIHYSSGRTRYFPWDQSMRMLTPRPHITVIHSAGGSYHDWVKKIHLASGYQVVLLSQDDVLLSLPVLPPQFSFSELAVIAHGVDCRAEAENTAAVRREIDTSRLMGLSIESRR